MKRMWLASIVLVVLGMSIAAPATAQFLVLESNYDGAKPGEQYPDSSFKDLPDGTSVKVLNLRTNKTLELKGKPGSEPEPALGTRDLRKK